jgi:hypothetical protein
MAAFAGHARADAMAMAVHRHANARLCSTFTIAEFTQIEATNTTTATETVHRKQLRPVIEDAATAMNRIFPARDPNSLSWSLSTWQEEQ